MMGTLVVKELILFQSFLFWDLCDPFKTLTHCNCLDELFRELQAFSQILSISFLYFCKISFSVRTLFTHLNQCRADHCAKANHASRRVTKMLAKLCKCLVVFLANIQYILTRISIICEIGVTFLYNYF